MNDFNIEEELKKIPKKPGVYLMHKDNTEVIYVGKAKNLYNRVHQYFNKNYKKTNTILQMVSNISYFEYIVVDNELESLILESNFIKEYRPRYNTLLKDDKNYPYIKLTTNETYPRIFMVHKKNKDKAMYFGPYKSSNIVKEVLEYIKDNYKIRSCNINIDNKILDFENIDIKKVHTKRNKECLYYHIDMCLAPCINKNVKEEYDKNVKEIIMLLSGSAKKIINDLNVQMENFSKELKFEKAMKIRDKINSINEIIEKQKIEQNSTNDKDVVGFFRNDTLAIIQIFEIRDGKIIDRNVNYLTIDKEDEDENIIESFIKQYYFEPYFMPQEIIIPIDIEDKNLLEEYLSRDKKNKTKITNPKIGQNERLIKLANTNAKLIWELKAKKIQNEENDNKEALTTLGKITGEDNINRIESYDISNIAGAFNVASMVCFEDNNFKKNEYRKFKINSVEGQNDYDSLKEVLTRRLERYINLDKKFSHLPQLFLIDGGKGQVNVVEKVLQKYNLNIPVIGMIKDYKHTTRGLIYNNEEMDLNDDKILFKFITKIQDETHRFAIEYNRHLRSKEQTHSILEEIKGLGEKKILKLRQHFENIDMIKNADVLELSQVDLITEKDAKNIYDFFHKE